jgi:hypothetical protein
VRSEQKSDREYEEWKAELSLVGTVGTLVLAQASRGLKALRRDWDSIADLQFIYSIYRVPIHEIVIHNHENLKRHGCSTNLLKVAAIRRKDDQQKEQQRRKWIARQGA